MRTLPVTSAFSSSKMVKEAESLRLGEPVLVMVLQSRGDVMSVTALQVEFEETIR